MNIHIGVIEDIYYFRTQKKLEHGAYADIFRQFAIFFLFKPLSAQNKHDFVLMFRNRNGFYKHVLSLLAGISSRRKNNYFILILIGFFDKPFFYVRVYAVRDNETRRFMFYRRFENVAYKLSRIMNRVGILINVFVNKAVYSLIC